ncbi:hypothetical protein DFR33_104124 [Bradymonas sediminis]|nr:hypothetical protein DFR33_104124 [Bradymonas sediminis]
MLVGVLQENGRADEPSAPLTLKPRYKSPDS